VTKLNHDYSQIGIEFNIEYIDLSDHEITNMMKHELLHVISGLHYRQDSVKISIGKFQNRLMKPIKENMMTLESNIRKFFLSYNQKSQENHEFIQEVISSFKYFYKYSTKKFWNIISDSALCMIAIEIGDKNFIDYWINADTTIVDQFEDRIKKFNKEFDKLNIERIGGTKATNEEFKKALQYMDCFNGMPYFAVAMATFGHKQLIGNKSSNFWKNKKHKYHNQIELELKNIERFKGIIENYTHKNVKEEFLKFYQQYLKIFEAQSKSPDPLNADLTFQIHNKESLSKGRLSYKLLNRGFYSILKGIKV
jgi:hypothetical protein